MLERSVRVVLTRQQMFSHVHRPEAVQKVKLGADEAGRLTAIINEATHLHLALRGLHGERRRPGG